MFAAVSQKSGTQAGYLCLEGLEKSYGDVQVVKNLNLSLPKGELVALLGPSGCGKTTTLRMIAGLASATSGQVLVNGRNVTDLPVHKRDMGLVFQSYALFPHMNVADNVAFGLQMRGVEKSEIKRRVGEALDMVRLGHLADRRPRALSGGQQQRVALARALVIQPSVLLLDEPLSNLDAKLRDEMRHEIRDIQQRLGITAVFVTHDQVEALSMCDKVAVMNNGRLDQIGRPIELYEHPETPFVASFVGRINQFSGKRRQAGALVAGHAIHGVNKGDSASADVTVMIRPHRIALVPKGSGVAPAGENRLAGTVSRITYVGELVQYDVDVGGLRFSVEQPTLDATIFLSAGVEVNLAWHARDTYIFGAAQ